jgi:hypothetical protein
VPNTIGQPRYAKQAVEQFASSVTLHVQSNPPADLHPPARADQRQARLMTVFAGAMDATFAALGVDTVYTPTRGKGSTELQSLDVEDAQKASRRRNQSDDGSGAEVRDTMRWLIDREVFGKAVLVP